MNPILVNSDNIQNFGFATIFKLSDKKILFDITGLTTFKSGGAANVLGIFFQVDDPSGIRIKEIDFDTPDIDPASQSTKEVNIPNALFSFGWWSIKGVIRDEDGTDTVITFKQNVCQPDDWNNGKPVGTFFADVNCYQPSVKIEERTKLIYNGTKALIVSKSGTLYYPQGTLSDINFTVTPFRISGASVYTGDYAIKNTTTARFDLGSNIYVELKYFTNQKFEVFCGSSVSTIICCISDARKDYNLHRNTQKGQAAKEKLDAISIPLFTALAKEKAGQDSSVEVKEIADILGCDCNCNANSVEPRPIGSLPDGTPASIVIAEGCGITIETEEAGDTTVYTFSSKQTLVTNQEDDPAFDIIKSEAECSITYAIRFNYDVLSNTILNSIKGSDSLKTLFNSIVDVTGQSLLSGLDVKCILDPANCSYLIQEKVLNTGVKMIDSITIGGVIYNAPDGLLLTSTVNIGIWLNGLGKGTFVVSLDSGTQTVSITSNNNPNVVTLLSMTFTSGSVDTPMNHAFSASCRTLVDILQAIINYLCDLDTAQVKTDKQYNIPTYDGSGNVSSTIVAANQSLSTFMDALMTAMSRIIAVTKPVVCSTMKEIYKQDDTKIFGENDLISATKEGSCVGIPKNELANILLTAISQNNALKEIFCTIANTCGTPICEPPTNVSAILDTGIVCDDVLDITGNAS